MSRSCNGCGLLLGKNEFSKNQWRKTNDSCSCKKCINASNKRKREASDQKKNEEKAKRQKQRQEEKATRQKQRQEEKEKERIKNLELYKENLKKEALHAEENPFTNKAWEKAKETFYDPKNCSPVKNLVWLEKWANNDGILMPKHLVCRIGTFVSTHTLKWKVKAIRWTVVGEEFERKISFENEVGPMMSTKLTPGRSVEMTITDPHKQLFAMKTKLWNPDGKKFVETRDSQTSFDNKRVCLEDIEEYHNPQVCYPTGTSMKDGINGGDTLKSIHWFPYSENVVSSLPYYKSNTEYMKEDELERYNEWKSTAESVEEYNEWKSTAKSWLAEAKFQAGDVLFYNNDLNNDFRAPDLELVFIACKYS